MRQRDRRRRDALLATLADHAPHVRARGIAAGLHVVLDLPPGGMGEDEIMARAAARSLGLMALTPCRHGAGAYATEGVVVGYAAAHAYRQAPAVLADVLGGGC